MTYSNIEELRAERNARLAACDFTMLIDFIDKTPVGEIQALKIYRKALRDLPARYEADDVITDVDWPEYPPITSHL